MMLNFYTTQETAAPTQGLTPNLVFTLNLLRSQLESRPASSYSDLYLSGYSNIYQSVTSTLDVKDQTANGQALKCCNGGATTVSVKFDLTSTEKSRALNAYDLTLTLELGSINDQSVFILTQSYTEDKLKSIRRNPRVDPTFVLKDLEIKDAKAAQNLVIRLTEKRKYYTPFEIDSPFTDISISNFNATFL